MKFIDLHRITVGNLRRTKLRTFLTVFGVIVSVSAIILLVSLSTGLEQITVNQIASSDALTRIDLAIDQSNSQITILNDKTVEDISKIEHINFVSPQIQIPAQLNLLDSSSDIALIGLKKDYLQFEGINLTVGNAFSTDSAPEFIISLAALKLYNKDKDPQSVIGKDVMLKVVAQNASNEENSKNEKVSTSEIKGKIIGVDSNNMVNNIYAPIDLLKPQNKNEYSSLAVKVDKRNNIAETKTKLEQEGFVASTVSDLVGQIDKAFLVVSLILAAIGAIALFVAAVGIVNTMTISLLERTREIGIMKALGAKNKDVRKMFIYESWLLGLIGGGSGILLGWLFGKAFNFIVAFLFKLSGQQTSVELFIIPWKFAVAILFFTLILALLSGLFPARRAAKLNPLDALRYE